MQYFQRDSFIEIKNISDFDPVKTFECGQCFRWNADENGVYLGVVKDKAARVWKSGDSIYISGSIEDFNSTWKDYFDLNSDYEYLRSLLNTDDYIKKAADFGAGIRILRQDSWEALCSFIISQCNNIPRIKKIVEALCQAYGNPFSYEGETLYTFPDAERIAGLTVSDLEPIRCGYRASYIIQAANAVASKEIELDILSKGSYSEALRTLKTISGVGDKVANCVILYGLHMTEAFPMDVWMKKAIESNYDKDFDPHVFGSAAGLAQQYIFYYARSGNT